MKKRLLILVVVVLVLALALALVTASASSKTETVHWDGQGPADPGCQEGETGKWHFVLTPGGNVDLLSGELTVHFSNGQTVNVVADDSPAAVLHFHVGTTAPAVQTVDEYGGARLWIQSCTDGGRDSDNLQILTLIPNPEQPEVENN